MVIKTLAVGTTPIFSQSIFFRDMLCVPNLKTWNSCQMIRRKVTFNPSFFLFCTCYIFSKEVWQLCQQHCCAKLCVEIVKNIQPKYLGFRIPKNMQEFSSIFQELLPGGEKNNLWWLIDQFRLRVLHLKAFNCSYNIEQKPV